MKKIIGLFLSGLFVVGCNSDDNNSQNHTIISDTDIENSLTRVSFAVNEGIQTDILNQRIEVIDDASTYNEFWLSISSMSGDMPTFNDATETMIAVISNAVSCVYRPIVTGVKESESSVIISMLNNQLSSSDQAVCNPSAFEFYAYNIVKVEKTNKPISVVFESSSSLSCSSLIDISGNASSLILIRLKEGQNVESIADEYKNIYGSGITIHRIFESFNGFSVEASDTVLLNLRCDERIDRIEYDEPEPPA